MAKIGLSPENLIKQLAEEFKLDPRDISYERMHSDFGKFCPANKPPDNSFVPFLAFPLPNERKAFEFIKRAFKLQGFALKTSSFFFAWTGHNQSRGRLIVDQFCPRCKTRLHRKEQRHKTHVLVTLTCPNRPWCKWGTSRVVPLTGARGALSRSVDHGDDLGEENPTESPVQACGGRLQLKPGAGIGPEVPATEATVKCCGSCANRPKEHGGNGCCLPGWRAKQVGAVWCDSLGAKCPTWQEHNQDLSDWSKWAPGSIVENTILGRCELVRFDSAANKWIGTDKHGPCLISRRKETIMVTPGLVIHEQNTIPEEDAKKKCYHPTPVFGMKVVLLKEIEFSDKTRLPACSIGKIVENNWRIISADYKVGAFNYRQNWEAMRTDPKGENSAFWRDNIPLDAWIKNEWVQFHDELYVGLEMKAMNSYGDPWDVGNQWKIIVCSPPTCSRDIPSMVIENTQSKLRISVSANEITNSFIPTSPQRD